jgi:site-specific recombinase XerD
MEKSSKFILNNRYSGMKKTTQRSILMMESGCKSPYTRNVYRHRLNQWVEHLGMDSDSPFVFDELIKISVLKVKEMVEDYVMYRKNCGLVRSTINNDICAITHFFRMNDIEIPMFKAKKFMPEQIKIRGDKPYTTELLQQALRYVSGYTQFNAVIHFLCATGARGGITEHLKMKHIGELKDDCKSVLCYADTKDEYLTFIHPEAIAALDQWLEYRKQRGDIVDKNSWVFCHTNDTSSPLHEADIDSRLQSKLKSLDRGELIHGRYDIAITYGMRKRWNLISKLTDGVNPHLSEKMFAHNSQSLKLDTFYLKPTEAQLLIEYKKFYPGLYISEEYRLKAELEEKNKIIIENQEEKDRRLVNQESRIAELEKALKGFTKY